MEVEIGIAVEVDIESANVSLFISSYVSIEDIKVDLIISVLLIGNNIVDL